MKTREELASPKAKKRKEKGGPGETPAQMQRGKLLGNDISIWRACQQQPPADGPGIMPVNNGTHARKPTAPSKRRRCHVSKNSVAAGEVPIAKAPTYFLFSGHPAAFGKHPRPYNIKPTSGGLYLPRFVAPGAAKKPAIICGSKK